MKELLSSLARAFGGHSQYSLADIGHAIRGQMSNNGWGEPAEVYARQAESELFDIWGQERNREHEDIRDILAAITEPY